jgi:hypothetical protein
MSEAEGTVLKAEGMETALTIHKDWQDSFREVVRELAQIPSGFTSEDVIDKVGLPSGDIGLHRNNAVGAMMSGMAANKTIKKTGNHVSSKRSPSHGAELTEWIGVRWSRKPCPMCGQGGV